MVEIAYAIGSVAVVIAALLAIACVGAQGILARWWATVYGRHVMFFHISLALPLTLWALRLIIPDGDWFVIARLAAFLLIPAVLAWRLVVIVRTWREQRRNRMEGDDGHGHPTRGP